VPVLNVCGQRTGSILPHRRLRRQRTEAGDERRTPRRARDSRRQGWSRARRPDGARRIERSLQARHAAEHRLARWFAAQIERYVPDGKTVHLRALHYQLLGSPKPDCLLYSNNEPTWDWLQKAAKSARWLGYVGFDRIRDERNDAPHIFVAEAAGHDGFGYLDVGLGVEMPEMSSLLPSIQAIGPIARQPRAASEHRRRGDPGAAPDRCRDRAEPLFSTADDHATAALRLIAAKRLDEVSA
jgi:hypothetical protein